MNVQPNDGFGTLLPNETIPIDINFSPKSAKEYKFTVLCKSLVNRYSKVKTNNKKSIIFEIIFCKKGFCY